MATSDQKRPAIKILKVVAINLLVLLVLLEVASVGFYFFRTGDFFYARKKGQKIATKTEFETRSQQPANDMTIIYQLHPYFGFVYRQGYFEGAYPANNCGFLSHDDFPFKKTNKDQFIIGIFGGSVAALFSFYELENHVLVNALRRSPHFENKEIVILNFAAGGYKQPQQLLVLSYFLSIGQQLDMVINIDGFNETALSYWNNRFGVDISMAPVHVVLPLIDLANKDLAPEELTLSLEILQTKNQLKDTLTQLDDARLATYYTLRWLKAKYLSSQYQKKLETFNALKRTGQGKDSLVHVNRIEKPLDDPEAYEQMANLWANSSLTMKGLLSEKRIQYFQFIQPNQYYATNRQFSEGEKRIAINDRSPNREGVIKGYPKVLSKVGSLKESGVNIFNAVNLFDEVKEIVYVDDCCHYNNVGNEVFANYIARSIIDALNNNAAGTNLNH
jgi:hypothetical protein